MEYKESFIVGYGGIHARPSAHIVNICLEFEEEIEDLNVKIKGKYLVDAGDVLGIQSLGADKDDVLFVNAKSKIATRTQLENLVKRVGHVIHHPEEYRNYNVL